MKMLGKHITKKEFERQPDIRRYIMLLDSKNEDLNRLAELIPEFNGKELTNVV